MKNKTYICNKCQRFLAELKQNGYLEIKNSKSISSNGKEFMIICKCKEVNIIKLK
ncbi:hypothetical protein [Fusobacterium varium]|uniref:hypothetical protein n=1 Tax=Fusobacterium varium TaxID=856 RepID=UPI003F1218D2